jgi:hypothetical protein
MPDTLCRIYQESAVGKVVMIAEEGGGLEQDGKNEYLELKGT